MQKKHKWSHSANSELNKYLANHENEPFPQNLSFVYKFSELMLPLLGKIVAFFVFQLIRDLETIIFISLSLLKPNLFSRIKFSFSPSRSMILATVFFSFQRTIFRKYLVFLVALSIPVSALLYLTERRYQVLVSEFGSSLNLLRKNIQISMLFQRYQAPLVHTPESDEEKHFLENLLLLKRELYQHLINLNAIMNGVTGKEEILGTKPVSLRDIRELFEIVLDPILLESFIARQVSKLTVSQWENIETNQETSLVLQISLLFHHLFEWYSNYISVLHSLVELWINFISLDSILCKSTGNRDILKRISSMTSDFSSNHDLCLHNVISKLLQVGCFVNQFQHKIILFERFIRRNQSMLLLVLNGGNCPNRNQLLDELKYFEELFAEEDSLNFPFSNSLSSSIHELVLFLSPEAQVLSISQSISDYQVPQVTENFALGNRPQKEEKSLFEASVPDDPKAAVTLVNHEFEIFTATADPERISTRTGTSKNSVFEGEQLEAKLNHMMIQELKNRVSFKSNLPLTHIKVSSLKNSSSSREITKEVEVLSMDKINEIFPINQADGAENHHLNGNMEFEESQNTEMKKHIIQFQNELFTKVLAAKADDFVLE